MNRHRHLAKRFFFLSFFLLHFKILMVWNIFSFSVKSASQSTFTLNFRKNFQKISEILFYLSVSYEILFNLVDVSDAKLRKITDLYQLQYTYCTALSDLDCYVV